MDIDFRDMARQKIRLVGEDGKLISDDEWRVSGDISQAYDSYPGEVRTELQLVNYSGRKHDNICIPVYAGPVKIVELGDYVEPDSLSLNKLTIYGTNAQLKAIICHLINIGYAQMQDSVYYNANILQMDATNPFTKPEPKQKPVPAAMVCEYCGRQAVDVGQSCGGCGHMRYKAEWL